MFIQTEIIQVIDISNKESSKIEYSLYADFSQLKFPTEKKAEEVRDKLNKIIEDHVRN